jgi:hypothetical protein
MKTDQETMAGGANIQKFIELLHLIARDQMPEIPFQLHDGIRRICTAFNHGAVGIPAGAEAAAEFLQKVLAAEL